MDIVALQGEIPRRPQKAFEGVCFPRRNRGGYKKKTEFDLGADREVQRLIERAGREKNIDLEAAESALRAAVLAAGAGMLKTLLQGVGRG